MLKIINGYPGSNLSEKICKGVAESLKLGKNALLIVPEQGLVNAERAIADATDAKYTFNVEVLSFKRLANRIFREYGGLCRQLPGKGAEMLYMWKALSSSAPMLKYYTNVGKSDFKTVFGLVETKKIFSRAGKTVKDLEKATVELEKYGNLKDRELISKLSDMALIFSAYNAFIQKDGNSFGDELDLMLSMPESGDFFKNKDIYLDSFNDFTAQEYDIIGLMVKNADNVCVSVNSRKNEKRFICAKPNECRKELLRLASRYLQDPETQVEFDNAEPMCNDPELAMLEKNMYSENKEICSDLPRSIKLYNCDDPVSEVETAMEDILKFIKYNGGRYRDCVIATPDSGTYSGIIKSVGEKYSLPVFTSHSHSLTKSSAIRAVKHLMNIINFDFRLEDVLEFIKTGFSPIDNNDTDKLEGYIRAWNIRGKRKWSRKWKYSPEGIGAELSDHGDLLEEYNGIREKIYKPISELYDIVKNTESSLELLSALANTLIEFGMPEKLEALAEQSGRTGNNEAKEFHHSVWQEMCNCLDTVYDCTKDIDISFEALSILLFETFKNSEINLIPTSVDEVLSGDISMLRHTDPKRIYILGLNDGVFPKAESGSGLLSGNDLKSLNEIDIKISSYGEEKYYEELFSFYSLACCAREHLHLSYHKKSLSGDQTSESGVISEIRSIIPQISENFPEEYSLDKLRFYNTEYKVTKETSERLFGDTLSPKSLKEYSGGKILLSQSKLDRFVLCPFSYMCSYILKLNEEKQPEIGQNLFGTIIHYVLENVMKYSKDKGGISNVSEDELRAVINSTADEYYEQSGLKDIDDIRVFHLFRRIKYTCELLLEDIKRELETSRFVPMAFELPVGMTGSENELASPCIKLDDGGEAFIRGYIDRVDMYESDDGKAYVKIVDYKTGTKTADDIDMENGINIQMILYMASICKNASSNGNNNGFVSGDKELVPAGVLYHISQRPSSIDGKSKKVARNGFMLSDDVMNGVLNEKANTHGKITELTLEEFYGKLDIALDVVKRSAQRMQKGECGISPLKTKQHDGCKYCPMLPICRRREKASDKFTTANTEE